LQRISRTTSRNAGRRGRFLLAVLALAVGLATVVGAEAQAAGGLAPRAYVVATYDGSTLRLYVNGEQTGTEAVRGQADVNKFPIEIGSWVGGSIWQGTIDDVAIYKQPLSASAVRRHYNIGLGQAGKSATAYRDAVDSSPGLVSYWRLDDRGSKAVDRRGVSDGAYRAGVSHRALGLITGDDDTAADFNGKTGSVIVPVKPALDVSKRFTLEAWVTAESVGNRHIVGRYGSFLVKTDPSGHWTAGMYDHGQLHMVSSPLVAGPVAGSPNPAQPATHTAKKAHDSNATTFLIVAGAVIAVGAAGWILVRPLLRRGSGGAADGSESA
jgi:Concanavalin A-like lectin/glucanases superfamily